MPPLWTLADIEYATGMSGSQLRYAIDACVRPELREVGHSQSPGRGSPRTFTSFEAFALAVAVRMLGSGIKRSVVITCLNRLCSYHPRYPGNVGKTALYTAFHDQQTAFLELCARGNVRFVSKGAKNAGQAWMQPDTRAELGNYEPPVSFCVDIQDLRTALKK